MFASCSNKVNRISTKIRHARTLRRFITTLELIFMTTWKLFVRESVPGNHKACCHNRANPTFVHFGNYNYT